MTKTTPQPNAMPEVEIVARTLWGEARGMGAEGMRAVACVIRNRMDHPRWWGGPDAASVCLARYQFSCWNEGDPNRAKLLAVTADDAAFRDALAIAEDLLADTLEDVTAGADHYCTKAVAPRTKWANGKTPVAQHGSHLFYRLELPAGGMKPLRKSRTVQAGAGGLGLAGAAASLGQVKEVSDAARGLAGSVLGDLPPGALGYALAGLLALAVAYMLYRRWHDARAAA